MVRNLNIKSRALRRVGGSGLISRLSIKMGLPSLRRPLWPLFIFCLGITVAVSVSAQQKGQYLPGQAGLNAGVLPDPGFTYQSMTINYSSDTLKGPKGNAVPLTGSYDIWAIENYFIYVPNYTFLGAKLAFVVIAPTFANGSLTLGSINFPNAALEAGGTGLADMWVQPLTLAWSLKRVDIYAAEAFMAPVGRYTPGAKKQCWFGILGKSRSYGDHVYVTKNKGTTLNLFTDWEIHGSKTIGQGTHLTPGQAFTDEWGLGQVLPLKKDFSRLLQLGVIGYDQWQVSDNGGFVTLKIPASLVPHYSVHTVGFQSNFVLPAKALNFFFKFEDEYRAFSRPEGRTFVFAGSWTWRMSKPPKS